MAGKSIPILLVTANVGSIFEDPSVMLKVWAEEFLSTVARLDPKFIALHCQEVGGKNYKCSMKHVEYFVRLLISSEELRLFDRVQVFLDEDFSSAENFTALGNFYFIHESLPEVLIWDFTELCFVPAKGKEIHSGNIENVNTKEKAKFPQVFFPECKWSRKGFLRTRWNMNGTVFDLINIHLFHDASNFVAMESFPSVYCKNRRRALEHTLDRFHKDAYGSAPFFLFGDFNFRTDTQGVVKKLTEGLNPIRIQSNKNTDHTKLQYRDGTSQVILTLGKKEFSYQDHQTKFTEENGKWLKEFDRELEPFAAMLYEFPLTFQPSYPFEEDERGSKCYMKTRCPSWCDRILLSNTAKSLVKNISQVEDIKYDLMGLNISMGDHKPVYLKLNLDLSAGMIPCDCKSENPRCFGLYLSADARSMPLLWSYNHSNNRNKLDCAAVSSMLLASRSCNSNTLLLPSPDVSILHDPYTPESMETPSSSPTPSTSHPFEFPSEMTTKTHSQESEESISKVHAWNIIVNTYEGSNLEPDQDVIGNKEITLVHNSNDVSEKLTDCNVTEQKPVSNKNSEDKNSNEESIYSENRLLVGGDNTDTEYHHCADDRGGALHQHDPCDNKKDYDLYENKIHILYVNTEDACTSSQNRSCNYIQDTSKSVMKFDEHFKKSDTQQTLANEFELYQFGHTYNIGTASSTSGFSHLQKNLKSSQVPSSSGRVESSAFDSETCSVNKELKIKNLPCNKVVDLKSIVARLKNEAGIVQSSLFRSASVPVNFCINKSSCLKQKMRRHSCEGKISYSVKNLADSKEERSLNNETFSSIHSTKVSIEDLNFIKRGKERCRKLSSDRKLFECCILL